jgi:hypothetical protein
MQFSSVWLLLSLLHGKALNQGWIFISPVFQNTCVSAASQHSSFNGFSGIFAA